MKYSAALSERVNQTLITHLLRDSDQEDLCFALYAPSTGHQRMSGLIKEVILPKKNERNLHGNVSFNSDYLDRVTSLAFDKKLGVCFLHSHLVSGWQGMSSTDISAEKMLAPRIKANTGLPLLGMTVGTDNSWSARFWVKTEPKQYDLLWCDSVRVIGEKFRIDYADHLYPAPKSTEEFIRTVSAWGDSQQANLSRLKIGIVGLGSVGAIVAETLMRTGIRNIILIDFDRLKRKNLDRSHSMSRDDIGRLKVYAYEDFLHQTRIDDHYNIQSYPYSIIEEEGLKAALDCDMIFSCVDRPWPRYNLNMIAYAHLIPVIDGGIDASINKKGNNIGQARWKDHTVGPGRRCLKCLGQFDVADVSLEISGQLEDPTYIQTLPEEHFIHRGENVFLFSQAAASQMTLQFASFFLYPCRNSYGPRETNFTTGKTYHEDPFDCDEGCETNQYEAMGNKINQMLVQEHPIANKTRAEGLFYERLFQKRKMA